jgi:hypothetical protein
MYVEAVFSNGGHVWFQLPVKNSKRVLVLKAIRGDDKVRMFFQGAEVAALVRTK